MKNQTNKQYYYSVSILRSCCWQFYIFSHTKRTIVRIFLLLENESFTARIQPIDGNNASLLLICLTSMLILLWSCEVGWQLNLKQTINPWPWPLWPLSEHKTNGPLVIYCTDFTVDGYLVFYIHAAIYFRTCIILFCIIRCM